jgi:hypothetical protein
MGRTRPATAAGRMPVFPEGSAMLKTAKMDVTPAMARQWLKYNTRNRPLRPSHVERLKASFERGEYVMTHQGIAFATDGSVIDGQHRLHAIADMPDGTSFPMLVTLGLKHEDVFPVVDVVSAGRSVSDVLGVDRKAAEVGMFLCRIANHSRSGITPTLAAPYIALTHNATADLLAYCGRVCKTWSAAPVRAAAVYNIMRGQPADYVKASYAKLVSADFDAMEPVHRALFRSNLTGKVRSTDAHDLFVRATRAFNPVYAKNIKVQINDLAGDMAEVRFWLDGIVPSAQKNAPAEAEAKVSKARRHSTSARAAA